ncbi:MAG: alpha/beta hydrolase [Pseudomonadota bacterium]
MPTISINGHTIHYITNREIPGDVGKRVVYIHGTGCNGRVFERHINAIPEHHALALDLSGHGESSGSGYRGVVDHAHWVASFIQSMDWEPCVVAGHSMGGGIAIALAIYFPELVERLLLIDTGARLRVAPAVIDYAKRIAAGGVDKVNNRQGFADGTAERTIKDLRAINVNENPNVTLKDWYADDSCDFLSRVGDIKIPSLAICGREDQLTPLKYHEYLRDNMPNCKLEIIDNAGHWPFVEQPQHFDEIVKKFLAS